MSEPERFYVVSLKTVDHGEAAYIGCVPGKDPWASRESAWFISTKAGEAHNFGSLALARDFQRQIKEGEAFGLKNDGHVWQVSDNV
ncbi:MAG: hypothetical protein ABI895_24685 [Deltaproteobacteria bacterium]